MLWDLLVKFSLVLGEPQPHWHLDGWHWSFYFSGSESELSTWVILTLDLKINLSLLLELHAIIQVSFDHIPWEKKSIKLLELVQSMEYTYTVIYSHTQCHQSRACWWHRFPELGQLGFGIKHTDMMCRVHLWRFSRSSCANPWETLSDPVLSWALDFLRLFPTCFGVPLYDSMIN